ncbi:MAG: B12-binding domain-containing radical SAM protein [Candidatus Doudnabacteria bacterium]|nr:B12-binding domain-containing radical SAM protein [Candidatus Doudnabacteria bacterium]
MNNKVILMGKNVLLVSQNKGYKYSPMGTLFVADAMEKAGYNVTLLDSSVPIKTVMDTVSDIDPVFVGETVYTTPTIFQMIDIAKAIKSETNIPIVWGGVHPTLLASQCIKEEYVDYVVIGEGEKTIVDLANSFSNGAPEKKIWASNEFIKDLDKYAPAWHLVDGNQYVYTEEHSVRGNLEKTRKRVFYYMITSRGCPYRCAFCYVNAVHRSTWRPQSVQWVKNQLDYIDKNYDIDGIGFWDDFFLIDVRRALSIVEYMKSKEIGFMCETRATLLTDSFMKKLKENGCMQLFIGGESGSPRVLKMIKKEITPADLIKAAELGYKHDIPVRISFMFGIPGEKFEDMIQTKELIIKLLEYPNVSISGPKLYTPYPGTELYDTALKYGFTPPVSTLGWKDIHRQTNLEYLPWFKKELEENGIGKDDIFLDIKDVQRKKHDTWSADNLYNKK